MYVYVRACGVSVYSHEEKKRENYVIVIKSQGDPGTGCSVTVHRIRRGASWNCIFFSYLSKDREREKDRKRDRERMCACSFHSFEER